MNECDQETEQRSGYGDLLRFKVVTDKSCSWGGHFFPDTVHLSIVNFLVTKENAIDLHNAVKLSKIPKLLVLINGLHCTLSITKL